MISAAKLRKWQPCPVGAAIAQFAPCLGCGGGLVVAVILVMQGWRELAWQRLRKLSARYSH
jgi:hypothetical protein